MSTTIADVKRANSNAHRTSSEINASALTNPGAVGIWLRELMLLEAAIRRYTHEHGITPRENNSR